MNNQEQRKELRNKTLLAYNNGDQMAFIKYAKSFGYKGRDMMVFVRNERELARQEAK